MLPSASGLQGLRNRAPASGGEEYRIAILADPVFTTDDPRIAFSAGDASVMRGADLKESGVESGRSNFTRLPGTLHEARVIQDLIKPGEALVLTGFAANRHRLTNGSLDDYDILHLATHGIVNPTHPGCQDWSCPHCTKMAENSHRLCGRWTCSTCKSEPGSSF